MNILKRIYNNILKQYGNEDDKKDLKRKCAGTCIILIFLIVYTLYNIFSWVGYYLLIVECVMLCGFVAYYFFLKKENSHKYKSVKIASFMSAIMIWIVLFSPIILFVIFKNIIGKRTDNIYIIKRNGMCFVSEVMIHFIIAIFLIYTIINFQPSRLYILGYCCFYWGIDFCCTKGIRKLLLPRQSFYYELYRYEEEIGFVGEYVFLGLTMLSFMTNSNEDQFLIVPILIFSSLFQVFEISKRKKSSNIIINYLNDMLLQFRELNEIFLNIETEELNVEKYIDIKRNANYKLSNNRSRVTEAFIEIEKISDKSYKLPTEKDEARKDFEYILNVIARALV